MGNADPECIVDRPRDAILYRQRGAAGELVEARDAGFATPGSQAKRLEVVDTVRYSEALHHRHESDAAGHDEDRRVTAKTLKDAAQPAQEPLDPRGAISLAQHPLEEYGQLVHNEKNALVVFCAAQEQPFPFVSPVSGVQFRADFQAKLARSDFLNGSKRSLSHVAQPRHD